MAAKAIVWAAHNPRRELMVGWPTVKAILGNAVAPGLADRYLARSGYDAQQTDRPVSPDRRDNLFEPVDVDEDRGAHGPFDDESRERSVQAAFSRHRRSLGLGALGSAALLGAFRRR